MWNDARRTGKARVFGAVALLAGLLMAVPASAGKPYQALVNFEIAAGATSQCQAFTVPTGNRLTINFASVLIQASANGQQISGVILYTSMGGQAETFNIVPVTTLISSNAFQGAQTMVAYADPGTNTRICVSRSPVFTGGVLDIYGSVAGTLDAL